MEAEPTHLTLTANLTLATTPHGDFLAMKGDVVTKHLQRFGGHTRPYVSLLSSLVGNLSRVLDIGAHIGTFSVPLGLRLPVGGQLWSFEPNEESFRLLQMNLALNGLMNRTTAIPMAVSDRSTTLFSVKPEATNTGANFLIGQRSRQASGGPISALSIDALMADGALDGADLIKIDVEGMETQVLKGARSTLVRYQPFLFIELSKSQMGRYDSSPLEIQSFLRDLGYSFYIPLGPRNRASDEVTIEEIDTLDEPDEIVFDVLAVPKSKTLPSLMFPPPGDAA
jgi:FkbM family methyltransferase